MVTADPVRLMTVAKSTVAASYAAGRAARIIESLKLTDDPRVKEVEQLLAIASAALAQVPGQLNWYIAADASETISSALAEYKLSHLAPPPEPTDDAPSVRS